MNWKVSSVGYSCFLPLVFVSRCPSSAVSAQPLFLAAGPRFGMTKGSIWLIVVCLMFFLSHLLSVCRSLSTGRWEMDQVRAGRGETDRDRDNAGGDSNAGRHRGADTPDRYIFCYFCILYTHLLYSLVFFLVASFSAECNNRAGRDVTNACGKSNAGRGNKGYVFWFFFGWSPISIRMSCAVVGCCGSS